MYSRISNAVDVLGYLGRSEDLFSAIAELGIFQDQLLMSINFPPLFIYVYIVLFVCLVKV